MIPFVLFSLLTDLSTEVEPPPPGESFLPPNIKTKPPPEPISCYKCFIRSTETEIKVHGSEEELLAGPGTVFNSSLHANIIELCPKMDCLHSCALVTGEATITHPSVAFPTQVPWYETPGTGAGGGQAEATVNVEYRTCASPAFDMCTSFPELHNDKCRQQVCRGNLCNAGFLEERKNSFVIIIVVVVVAVLVVLVVVGLILLWLYKKRQRKYEEIEQEQQRMVKPRVGLFRRVLITVGVSKEPDLVPAPPDGESPEGKEGWFSNWKQTLGISPADELPAPQPETSDVERGWFSKMKNSGSVRWGKKGYVEAEVGKIEVVTAAPPEHTEKRKVKINKKDTATEDSIQPHMEVEHDIVKEEKRTVKSVFKFGSQVQSVFKSNKKDTATEDSIQPQMEVEEVIVKEDKRTVKSVFKFSTSVFMFNKKDSAAEEAVELQVAESGKQKKSREPDDTQVTITKEQKTHKPFWRI